MTRTALATGTAGLALLTLTGCVSLDPGEGQAMSQTASAADTEEENRQESRGGSLAHPVEDADVFTHMVDAGEDVEALRAEMTMSFELDAPWTAVEQEAEVTTEGAEDYSATHLSASTWEDGREAETAEAYFQDDVVLTNIDDAGWEEESSDGLEDDADSRYTLVVDGLAALDQLLEVDYDDEVYVLEYSGSDLEAFEAFEEPFALSLDGYEPEETDMTVDAVVDPETFHVEEFSFTLHTKDSPNPISLGMEIAADYSLFNDIPDLQVPEDVLEEAYGPQH